MMLGDGDVITGWEQRWDGLSFNELLLMLLGEKSLRNRIRKDVEELAQHDRFASIRMAQRYLRLLVVEEALAEAKSAGTNGMVNFELKFDEVNDVVLERGKIRKGLRFYADGQVKETDRVFQASSYIEMFMDKHRMIALVNPGTDGAGTWKEVMLDVVFVDGNGLVLKSKRKKSRTLIDAKYITSFTSFQRMFDCKITNLRFETHLLGLAQGKTRRTDAQVDEELNMLFDMKRDDVSKRKDSEEEALMELNPSQRVAVEEALHHLNHNKIFLWQGPPGSGKTRAIATYVDLLQPKLPETEKIMLCGPSNFSVKVLLESFLVRRHQTCRIAYVASRSEAPEKGTPLYPHYVYTMKDYWCSRLDELVTDLSQAEGEQELEEKVETLVRFLQNEVGSRVRASVALQLKNLEKFAMNLLLLEDEENAFEHDSSDSDDEIEVGGGQMEKKTLSPSSSSSTRPITFDASNLGSGPVDHKGVIVDDSSDDENSLEESDNDDLKRKQQEQPKDVKRKLSHRKSSSPKAKRQKSTSKLASFRGFAHGFFTQLFGTKNYASEGQLVQELIENSQLVFSTLAMSGPHTMGGKVLCVHTLIVDEAAASCEAETWIALQHDIGRMVLVGDQMQLPPTVHSKSTLIQRSLMERLVSFTDNTVRFFNIQYRMHGEISKFPRAMFYEGKLLDDGGIKDRKTPSWFQVDGEKPWYGHYAFIHVEGKEKLEFRSKCNSHEATAVKKLLQDLDNRGLDLENDVVVITFYAAQKQKIQSKLESLNKNIQVATVDSFQGKEADVVILSSVRANPQGNFGFLEKDDRRLNVALTRAKTSLIILGHKPTFQKSKSKLLQQLIQDAQRRNVIFDQVQ